MILLTDKFNLCGCCFFVFFTTISAIYQVHTVWKKDVISLTHRNSGDIDEIFMFYDSKNTMHNKFSNCFVWMDPSTSDVKFHLLS